MSANPAVKQVGPKWPWRASGAMATSAAAKPPMSIAVKAAIQAPIMIGVGALIFFYFGHAVGAYIVWALAALVLFGGLVYPPLFHGFERFGQKLAKWVAVGLTYGLLVPFYYLCFVPGRIIMSLRGADPMNRKVPTDLPSYWEARPTVHSLEQYKKQH